MAIQTGDYDNLLNSKSEWAMNAFPRQKIVYKDVLWENDPVKGENGAPNKPPDDTDPPDKRLLEPNEFESQYTQRKKRRKLQTGTAAEARFENPDRVDTQAAKSRQVSRQTNGKDQQKDTTQNLDLSMQYMRVPSKRKASK